MLMKRAKLYLSALFVLLTVSLFAQNAKVSGTIKDATTGEAVPFASVMVKGTMNGASSDADGVYTINAPASGVLSFSAVGYSTFEAAVNGRGIINVILSPDNQQLNETIVVAFGTATKSSFTGSAAVVDEEKLSKAQVASVTNALAGAVAGVQLTSSNGAPGSTSTIRVRGFSSINAGQSPLIILDGAPYSGDIANINQSDVASMTVLKDAASSALYGARGANGVIIITTKKAKAGEATVTFDAKYGFNSKALQQYDVITNPGQYYELQYAALDNYYLGKGLSAGAAHIMSNNSLAKPASDGGVGYMVYTVPENQYLIGSNGKLNPAATLGRVSGDYYLTPDDWAAEGYRYGARQEYNLSVAGSNDRSSFYSSLSYLDNQGITDASDLQRFTGRLRADYQSKKWLKVGANMSYSRFNGNSLGNNGSSTSTGNVWAFTSQTAPIYPIWVRNADGSIKVDANGIKIMDYGNGLADRGGVPGSVRPFISDANPIQDSRLNTMNHEGNALTANAFADFTIIPGLVLTINGTVDLDETRYTNVYNPYYGQFDSTGGTVEKEHDRSFSYNYQQLLNYTTTIASHHNVNLMIGHEYYNDRTYVLGASRSKMFSQANKELSGAVVDGKSSYSSIAEYNNEGYFARAQYDYDNRIFGSASFRRDASSRFNPSYQWGSFWSVGGAWLLNKEKWFTAPWVNELKFKASGGSQGNDNIGSYRYTDVFDITNSAGLVGTSFASKGTKEITWETNMNINAGFEFTLFNSLTGSLEYFDRKTSNMLFEFPVAPSLGYSNYYDNVGNLYNAGLELDLNYNIFNKKDFRWDVNFNLTSLKNRITMLHNDKKVATNYDAAGKAYKGYTSGNFFISEGLSMYTWRLKEYAGVDPTTGVSLWYKNTFDDSGNWNGRETTDTYSKADYYVTDKTSIPDLYGGFGTSVQVYGVDFGFNMSYQVGGYQYDGTYAQFMSTPTASNSGYNFSTDVLKAWTGSSSAVSSDAVPRWVWNDTYSAAGSTRFLTKSSYLNIENVTLGYTLPSKWTKVADISSARIYVTASNVWYWSMRKGFDPRQSYSSTTNATNYSPMRTVSAGVTIKF